ncbi:MAG TPA: UbiA prenyltransferase family protein [Patescibacteria group bacterium]|nr:UbiA prenyltransferase family protein [Patescibacteria group bacterium]
MAEAKKNLNIFNIFFAGIQVARPIHWIKNLSLFAALIFTQTLFIPSYQIAVFWAFLAFNFITSASYVFNDILDVKEDRLHPIKKYRPVASGALPVSIAIAEVIILASISLYLAYFLHPIFFVLVVTYFVIQVLYSIFLKDVEVIDILVIASGFILRVYAGAFVIDAHLSVWFLLCVISIALFLASGKRRAELNTIQEVKGVTRKSLTRYSKELLNSYVTMFGNAAWMSWALFTFFESPRAALPIWLFLAEISKATTITKLLMITIPVAIFGIMRYEKLIFADKSEAPEKLLLTDVSLVTSVGIWTFLVISILYSGISVNF